MKRLPLPPSSRLPQVNIVLPHQIDFVRLYYYSEPSDAAFVLGKLHVDLFLFTGIVCFICLWNYMKSDVLRIAYACTKAVIRLKCCVMHVSENDVIYQNINRQEKNNYGKPWTREWVVIVLLQIICKRV